MQEESNSKQYEEIKANELEYIPHQKKPPTSPRYESSNTFLNTEKVQIDTELRRHSKLDRIIDILIERKQKFSLIDYFRNKCKCKSKRLILYGHGMKNLSEILDIQKYVKNNLELKLIKNVLFDEYQLKIFNTISSIIGFKEMFDEEAKKDIKLCDYQKVEFNDFFDFIQVIMSRKNLIDQKIMSFVNNQLLVHC